jgi:hypothetical protein
MAGIPDGRLVVDTRFSALRPDLSDLGTEAPSRLTWEALATLAEALLLLHESLRGYPRLLPADLQRVSRLQERAILLQAHMQHRASAGRNDPRPAASGPNVHQGI